MRPQIFQVFSQTAWPGIGDVDDCWVLASLQAVHTVAPWLKLPGVKVFREKANVPDVQGQLDVGDEHDMARGLAGLYPNLPIEVADGMPFPEFVEQVRSGRPAAVVIRAGDLPQELQHVYQGIHAVTVAFDDESGDLLIADPLAKPHSKPVPIAQPALRAAIKGFQPDVHAVLMPTIEQALRTHEIHQQQVNHLRRRIRALKARLTAAGIDPGAEVKPPG
jgi:hypothetical protein